MKTPEQIAVEVFREQLGSWPPQSGKAVHDVIVAAIEADRAQRYEVPTPLAGAIEPTDGGVFRNARGDYLVEPIGDETGELILVRADGTTATMTGDWETGWEA